MKQSEKIYQTKSLGFLITDKEIFYCVIINDFENSIENQIIEKRNELIEKGYVFKNNPLF